MREECRLDLGELAEAEETFRLEAQLVTRDRGKNWTTRFAASGKDGKRVPVSPGLSGSDPRPPMP